jgi:hypothetical protein
MGHMHSCCTLLAADGYGEQGREGVPPSSTLEVDITLTAIYKVSCDTHCVHVVRLNMGLVISIGSKKLHGQKLRQLVTYNNPHTCGHCHRVQMVHGILMVALTTGFGYLHLGSIEGSLHRVFMAPCLVQARQDDCDQCSEAVVVTSADASTAITSCQPEV